MILKKKNTSSALIAVLIGIGERYGKPKIGIDMLMTCREPMRKELNMTADEKLIKIKNMVELGLKAQLMREDRNLATCWRISLRIADRIVAECKKEDV